MMKLPVPILALTIASLAGCYSYVPAGIESVSPGETVRARLTSEATDRLPVAVRGDGQSVSGELLARDGGEVILFLPSMVRQQGFFAEKLHERVSLSYSDVIELERKVLDHPRTYMMLGVATAAVTAIAIKVFTGKTGGNTIDRTDDGPAANLIPLFRIRFP
jgi:hypothetical protein